jgi:hypothetical protein
VDPFPLSSATTTTTKHTLNKTQHCESRVSNDHTHIPSVLIESSGRITHTTTTHTHVHYTHTFSLNANWCHNLSPPVKILTEAIGVSLVSRSHSHMYTCTHNTGREYCWCHRHTLHIDSLTIVRWWCICHGWKCRCRPWVRFGDGVA